MFSEQYRNEIHEQRLSDEATDRILDTLHRESAARPRRVRAWRAVAVAAALAVAVTAMVPHFTKKPPTVSFYPEREDSSTVTITPTGEHLTYQEAFAILDGLGTLKGDTLTEEDAAIRGEIMGLPLYGEPTNSTTNTQYAAVDEADVIKAQDGYIYTLNQKTRQLTVFRANGKKTAAIATQTIGGWRDRPLNMYITDDRLTVLYQHADVKYSKNKTGGTFSYADNRLYTVIYDISDPTAPRYLAEYGQDGTLSDSRMVGGVLYLVTAYSVWAADEEKTDSYVPSLYRGEQCMTMAENALISVPDPKSSDYAVITAVSVTGDTERISQTAVLGAGECRVWANSEHLLLLHAGNRRDITDTPLENGNTHRKTTHTTTTTLHLFDIVGGNVRQTAIATLDGTLDGQFAVDEWNGHFRVAATCGYAYSEREITLGEDDEVMRNIYLDSEYTQYNRLYVLDSILNEVGCIDNMAPGETVRSVRFEGDIGYVVTFRQTDPLFAIDLSNPANPTVLSALKITGFSEYLHPFTDDRLFGFGYAGTEDGINGRMKLTMFNTADKTDVTALHTLELPSEYVFSEALGDHHAILVDPARQLIGFPAYTAAMDLTYVLFRYSETEGFTLLAHPTIKNADTTASLRGLFIDNCFYVAHQNGLCVYDRDFALITAI